VANLRGGSEYGEEWHRAGNAGEQAERLDDFMAAAQWLVTTADTSPRELVHRRAQQRWTFVSAWCWCRDPSFWSLVCGVPVTDMLRYHKFDSGARTGYLNTAMRRDEHKALPVPLPSIHRCTMRGPGIPAHHHRDRRWRRVGCARQCYKFAAACRKTGGSCPRFAAGGHEIRPWARQAPPPDRGGSQAEHLCMFGQSMGILGISK